MQCFVICRYISLLRPTRQLSGAPEGHLSRTPGSPVAERREGAPAQPRILPERSEGRTPELTRANEAQRNEHRC